MMRRKLDMTKLAQLPTANEMLDKKYGAEGTESRATFDAESKAWYEEQLSGSYRITMPKNLHQSLVEFTREKGISISSYISELVNRELQLSM